MNLYLIQVTIDTQNHKICMLKVSDTKENAIGYAKYDLDNLGMTYVNGTAKLIQEVDGYEIHLTRRYTYESL